MEATTKTTGLAESVQPMNEGLLAECLEETREEAQALRIENSKLHLENQALRDSLTMMHRRAQKNEGAQARLERVRAGYDKDLRTQVQNVTYWRNEGHRMRRRANEAEKILSKIPRWIVSGFAS